MQPSDLTEANLFDILLDPRRRGELRAAMRREQGTRLPLSNHYSDVAYTAEDAAKLGEAVLAVLQDAPERDWDDLLDPLLSNPGTPHEALWAAYRQGGGSPPWAIAAARARCSKRSPRTTGTPRPSPRSPCITTRRRTMPSSARSWSGTGTCSCSGTTCAIAPSSPTIAARSSPT